MRPHAGLGERKNARCAQPESTRKYLHGAFFFSLGVFKTSIARETRRERSLLCRA